MDIIFDVDGTLMNISHRRHHLEGSPKNWVDFRRDAVDDTPNLDVFAIALALRQDGHQIIVASGRMESERDLTKAQLHLGGLVFISPVLIQLRADGDHRDDTVVKREMLAEMRKAGLDPKLAFDDRSRVIDMWRAEGLRAVQVAPGDF
jgi:hypothetical protein